MAWPTVYQIFSDKFSICGEQYFAMVISGQANAISVRFWPKQFSFHVCFGIMAETLILAKMAFLGQNSLFQPNYVSFGPKLTVLAEINIRFGGTFGY